ENIISIDLLTTIPSIYLTATPSRSNYLENRVFQIVYSGVYKFTSTSKKIKNKREKYHRVIICKYDTEPSEEFLAKFKKASRSRGFNVNVYMNYILEEKIDKLDNNIKTLLTRLVYPSGKNTNNKRTLILIKQIAAVDEIYERLLVDPDIDQD